MKKQRTISVQHSSKSGLRVEVRDTQRNRISIYGGPAFAEDITPASVKRLMTVISQCCEVAHTAHIYALEDTEGASSGVEFGFRYMPDVDFAEVAKRVDNGAVNPLAILNSLRDLAYRHMIIEKKGMDTLYDDPAYVLMFSQLLHLSFGMSSPWETYKAASSAIYEQTWWKKD